VPHFVRVLLTAGAFLGFGFGGFLLSVTILPLLHLAGGSRAARERRCQRMVGRAFRVFHAYMRWATLVDYQPKRIVSDGEPSVIIANHPTLIDTTAMFAAHPEMICVVKPSYYKNPFFLLLMWACGHVIEPRRGMLSSGQVIERLCQRLSDGHSVLIFPEGTRSPVGSLNPFRRGAFEIARRSAVRLRPVLIWVDQPLLKRDMPWYVLPRRSARVELEWMKDVPALETQNASSRTLMRDVERLYKERLALGNEARPEAA
jgi:1-acyl-sn-glycerol-3-phosphate acyltransferase